MSEAVYNFCAGPAMMPTAVLLKAQEELLDWQGRGVSVMEISHRSDAYVELAQAAEQKLRRLLSVPDDYAVLFCHGSASHQFSAVPLNLLPRAGLAEYVTTGIWSEKSVKEARRMATGAGLGMVNEVKAQLEKNGQFTVRDTSTWYLNANASYLHYCPNETIGGIEFAEPPVKHPVLVADMSSCILSKPINVSDYGLIYAGAQKNIGPAGMTIVIVRKDLMGKAAPGTPTLFNYAVLAENASMYNTPPTFAWYLADLVFDWLLEQGGVEAMAKRNAEKSQMLYRFIDTCEFYRNPIDPAYRSRMNVPFRLRNEALNSLFLAQADAAGLLALEGHRSVGGMRASLYNAMPIEGVIALIEFMADFAGRNS